jgi:hypothetical protein
MTAQAISRTCGTPYQGLLQEPRSRPGSDRMRADVDDRRKPPQALGGLAPAEAPVEESRVDRICRGIHSGSRVRHERVGFDALSRVQAVLRELDVGRRKRGGQGREQPEFLVQHSAVRSWRGGLNQNRRLYRERCCCGSGGRRSCLSDLNWRRRDSQFPMNLCGLGWRRRGRCRRVLCQHAVGEQQDEQQYESTAHRADFSLPRRR